jgi:hypothetical protein
LMTNSIGQRLARMSLGHCTVVQVGSRRDACDEIRSEFDFQVPLHLGCFGAPVDRKVT